MTVNYAIKVEIIAKYMINNKKIITNMIIN